MKNPSELSRAALKVLRPPPKQTVSEWADEHRRLSPEASALPGRWRTSVVAYMREPMDCVGQPGIHSVNIMAGAQVAKSELLLNVCGKLIDTDPCPILMLQPTLDMASAFSKERIAPMIRDTPRLRGKVRDSRSRDSDNTIFSKAFPGGKLTLVGANSAAGLASRPIRVVLFDEVDRYPISAGTEGDPINLATKRTVTFWNRINVKTSTPGVKGQSRIEMAFEEGDQRRYYCPCPHCGFEQYLKWSSVHWEKDKPETAQYTCEDCGAFWTEQERLKAIRAGHWRATAPFRGIASFHIPGMLSPFSPLSDGVREFLAAKGNPALLQTWVNTFLGETWEDRGKQIDTHALQDRAEEYETPIPDGVVLLTAGVDVQDDRIECETVGWGEREESWSIDHKVFRGDPTGSAVWSELRRYLDQSWTHPYFGEMQIRAMCVDTGYLTQHVYRFVQVTPRVFAIKGVGGEGSVPVGKPTRNNNLKVNVYPVGTMTVKDTVMARLKAEEGEDGYCHFPADRDKEYFNQLTAETLITRFHKGFAKREWVKKRPRNEAFDLRIYATAALNILRVDLTAQRKVMVREWARKTLPAPVKKKSTKRHGRFADRWKDY